MSVLRIERDFPIAPAKVFAFVTKADNLLKWWGPEGMELEEHQLDFSKLGLWSSTLKNAEGGLHKMSGEVMAIHAGSSVEFTWGWHDEADQRGHESTVRFEVTTNGTGGTTFSVIHSGLTDEESAANHGKGWASTLRKLARLING